MPLFKWHTRKYKLYKSHYKNLQIAMSSEKPVPPEKIRRLHALAALSLNLGEGNAIAVAADHRQPLSVADLTRRFVMVNAVQDRSVYFQPSAPYDRRCTGP